MVLLKNLLAFTALGSIALASGIEVEDVQAAPEGIDYSNVDINDMQKMMGEGSAQRKAPALKIDVNTSFPDAEIFGVKLVNGRATRALFKVTNNEAEPITFLVATGALLTPSDVPGAPDPPQIIRNLTVSKYGATIQPKTMETITYSFSTEMHPQTVVLDLKALVSRGESIFTLGVFQESVAIVEAPVSIFDPQIIFLYLILAAIFGGTCFAIYSVWIKELLPQKKRGGKGGERAKKSTSGSKKVDPNEQVAYVGADGPAVTTGARAYDESWIPAGHINKPAAKRVGGRPKSRAA